MQGEDGALGGHDVDDASVGDVHWSGEDLAAQLIGAWHGGADVFDADTDRPDGRSGVLGWLVEDAADVLSAVFDHLVDA